MEKDLTVGNERKVMLLFALPMIMGNILQQFYNIIDTIVVGKFIGAEALAAVGTSFPLMVFLTSVIIGLCMGSGGVLSMCYGASDNDSFKKSVFISFFVISAITIVICLLAFIFLDEILIILQVNSSISGMTKEYLCIIFVGIMFTAIYNYSAAILRSLGNSVVPVICMVTATIINIVLDLYFVVELQMGVSGVAWATIIAQAVSAILVTGYLWRKEPLVRLERHHMVLERKLLHRIIHSSALVSIQQSIMNFGILMIQGLVNSFGVTATAAFAAAVKIDAFAYIPVQDFGNAFGIFIAQNYGAGIKERIYIGMKEAIKIATAFSILISVIVVVFAESLMKIFIHVGETRVIEIGVRYLRIEGIFYVGIGILFLFYGFYRGIAKPEISLILTIVSLGIRVLLAYILAPIAAIGLLGIWWAIPIGWILADILGFSYYIKNKKAIGY
ncbi:MAG: MATE family efflux transporter [Lachnospiraceae bacterium]